MFKNHVYNLMAQLVEEHKSAWRIEEYYLDDVENCEECAEFWKMLKQDKEKHIKDLHSLIKDHINK